MAEEEKTTESVRTESSANIMMDILNTVNGIQENILLLKEDMVEVKSDILNLKKQNVDTKTSLEGKFETLTKQGSNTFKSSEPEKDHTILMV